MTNDLLLELQQWYVRQCNGEWEHHSGITIESLDNPGWLVKINLEGTHVAERAFIPVTQGDDILWTQKTTGCGVPLRIMFSPELGIHQSSS